MMAGAIFGYRGLVEEILARISAGGLRSAQGANRCHGRLRAVDRCTNAGDRCGAPAPDPGRSAHHWEFESLGENVMEENERIGIDLAARR